MMKDCLLNLNGNQTKETLQQYVLSTLDLLCDNVYKINDKDLRSLYNKRLHTIYNSYNKK